MNDRQPALITPRTLYTFAGGAAVAGSVMLLAPWHPLAGAVLVVAAGLGWLRARIAEREGRTIYEHDDKAAERPPGDHLRDGEN